MGRRAWILLAFLASLWGASYLFIKVSLDDLGPAGVVFGRTLLAALVLIPIALHRDALRGLRGRLGALSVLAGVQVAVPFLLISWGEEHIASSLTGILVSSAPIFLVLLAAWLDPEERARGWGLVGVAGGIVGIGLLFGVDLSGDTLALLGGFAVLGAGLCYAGGGLYLKRRLSGTPPVAVAAATMVISTLMTLPLLPFFPPAAPGGGTVAAMLALGVGGTGIAFLVYYTLIADVGPARAALVTYLAPVFAVLYGVLLLDEPFGPGTLAGLGLILAGSWLAAEGRPPGRRRPVLASPGGGPGTLAPSPGPPRS
ncbi:MAG: DMT family transporter [Solirubrobacteraceae bacterium MAG38_C4-C5]|nr:DMT family transporter [Candidatus Siliceabacter maunaloa]